MGGKIHKNASFLNSSDREKDEIIEYVHFISLVCVDVDVELYQNMSAQYFLN